MTFGLLGRCDGGGLGTITQEVFRHMRPERTLLLNLGPRGRGPCNELAYEDCDDQRVVPCSWDGGIPGRMAEWIGGRGITTLFSAETFYDDKIVRACKAEGVRTVMLAMPELAPWATTSKDRPQALKPDVLTIPTTWRLETLPTATLLPVPVARDRLVPTHRRRAAHLFHVTGAAHHDRNGTNLVLAAIPLMRQPCRFTIRTERPIRVPTSMWGVEVDVLDARVDNYWEVYPPDIDLLVMPRRFGGLCLPVQECASLGVPSVMLQHDPYAAESFVFTVDVSRWSHHDMKGAHVTMGNPVSVYDASPHALAAMLDSLIEHDNYIGTASAMANEWAEQMAWDGPLGEQWCAILDAGCATIAA